MEDLSPNSPTEYLGSWSPCQSVLRGGGTDLAPPGKGHLPGIQDTLWLGCSAGVRWHRAGGSGGFSRGVGHPALRAGRQGSAGGGRRWSHGGDPRSIPCAGHLQDPVPQPGDSGVDPWAPCFCTANAPAHNTSQEEPSRRLLADQGSSGVTLENKGTFSVWGRGTLRLQLPGAETARGGGGLNPPSTWAHRHGCG